MTHLLADLDIIPLEVRHTEVLLRTMREADRAEVFATVGAVQPEDLWRMAGLSAISYAWPSRGPVGAMFGVYAPSEMSLVGVPWLLTTPVVERRRKEFLRSSKRVLQYFLERFPELENHVDARHLCAIRWLRWLGFTVEEPEPWGKEKLPFHRFWIKSWAG